MWIERLALAVLLINSPSRAEIANIVVTSAASFENGMPPGGSIATVFCTGLKGIGGVVSAEHYPLPLELAGVRVTIDTTRAALFSVADLGGYQQINLQVPWEEYTSGTIVVEQGGERGTAVVQPDYGPGHFFQMQDGGGAFQHANFTLVNSNNAARAGEVIAGYFTGLMIRPSPSIATGQPAPAGQPSWENMMLKPTIGVARPVWEIQFGEADNKKLVAPSYFGLAPGLVGVYQVNFEVPEGLPPGIQQIRLVQNECRQAQFSQDCLLIEPNFARASVPALLAVK